MPGYWPLMIIALSTSGRRASLLFSHCCRSRATLQQYNSRSLASTLSQWSLSKCRAEGVQNNVTVTVYFHKYLKRERGKIDFLIIFVEKDVSIRLEKSLFCHNFVRMVGHEKLCSSCVSSGACYFNSTLQLGNLAKENLPFDRLVSIHDYSDYYMKM